jgi:hypothetical protein
MHPLVYDDLLEHSGGEDSEEIFESLAFALVEHGLAEDGIATEDTALLCMFEASEESGAEIEGLNVVEGWEEWFELLSDKIRSCSQE